MADCRFDGEAALQADPGGSDPGTPGSPAKRGAGMGPPPPDGQAVTLEFNSRLLLSRGARIRDQGLVAACLLRRSLAQRRHLLRFRAEAHNSMRGIARKTAAVCDRWPGNSDLSSEPDR